jgi:NAD+ kinase
MSSIFKTIALVGKYNSPEIGEPLLRLAQFLEERGRSVVVARQTAEHMGSPPYRMANLSDIGTIADLAIVLGGDGTMLSIVRTLLPYDIPLVGINQGRLGFLTDITVDDMLETIDEMLEGEFTSEDRLLLNAEIWRKGEKVFDACAFNDVVVSKGSAGRLIEFEVTIDGEFVYSQRSDGVVVATPTGSTAYALSAGGPILHPTLEAFALVPICPHTLSARPIAINSHSTIEITLTFIDDARVHFDGQRNFDLQTQDKVFIRRAAKTIRLLHPLGHSYYDMLRQKLHWGRKL